MIPNAVTVVSAANVLPSSTSATNSSRSSRRSHKVYRCRALARIKRRETLDTLSPKAVGTASAQASYCRQVRPTRTFPEQAHIYRPRAVELFVRGSAK